jgi:hypothetical protein
LAIGKEENIVNKIKRWFSTGILIPFGDGGTPVDFGTWRRIDPLTYQDNNLMFLPYHGIPTTLGPQRPRESSPTGKSGIGIATYSIAHQPIEDARRTVIMFDPDPIYKGDAKLTTQGPIDPYLTQINSPFNPSAHRPKFMT